MTHSSNARCYRLKLSNPYTHNLCIMRQPKRQTKTTRPHSCDALRKITLNSQSRTGESRTDRASLIPAGPTLTGRPATAALQFRGFADAQVRRLQGIGTGKKGQRHELIGVHGYDIKAAMHLIRLLNEGIELMRSGTITLPRPEKELLITIRTGNYGSPDRVLTLANTLFCELDEAEAKSGLPEKVDRPRMSELVSDTYLRHWTG